MKSIAICAILLALGVSYFYMTSTSSRSPIEEQYQLFLAEYGKSVANGEEYQMRLRIFEDNLKKIEEINSSQKSFTAGVNKFADMTKEEYKKYLRYFPITNKQPAKIFNGEVADAIDWRAKGAVNKIQDQDACGSCWAFAAAAGYEGAYFVKNGQLLKFSEQQLVDCSSNKGNEGCNGGFFDKAFEYLKETGFCLSSDYPYTGVDEKCKVNKCTKTYPLVSEIVFVENKNAALKSALNMHPVSVAVDATSNEFQYYRKGIFDSLNCGTDLNHAVTVVGYGRENNQDYWIVRNSWSQYWGDEGYIRISAELKYEKDGGICGILLNSSYPVLS